MSVKNILRLFKQFLNIISVGLFSKPFTGPIRICWAATYNCNSSCAMCSRWKMYKEEKRAELTTKEAESFISQCARLGVINLAITGGEPFLRNDLCHLFRFAKDKGISVVTSTTNGTLLSARIDEIINSGISLLSVSLDAVDRSTYKRIRGIDAYDCVISNISALVKAKRQARSSIKIAINTVVSALNYHQLPKIASIAQKLGVDSFNCGPINEIANDGFYIPKDMQFKHDSHKEQLKQTISFLLRNKKLNLRSDNKFYKGIPDFLFNPEKSRSVPCWATHFSLMIDAQGDIYPCCGRMSYLGNLRNINLRSVWFSNALKNVREDVIKGRHPLCWMSCYAPFRQHLFNILYSGLKQYIFIFRK